MLIVRIYSDAYWNTPSCLTSVRPIQKGLLFCDEKKLFRTYVFSASDVIHSKLVVSPLLWQVLLAANQSSADATYW